jgi:hypothetical protein
MPCSVPCHAGDTLVFPFSCPTGCGRFTAQPEIVCCALCVLPTGTQEHTPWCDRVQTTDTLTDHELDMLLFSSRRYITLEHSVPSS